MPACESFKSGQGSFSQTAALTATRMILRTLKVIKPLPGRFNSLPCHSHYTILTSEGVSFYIWKKERDRSRGMIAKMPVVDAAVWQEQDGFCADRVMTG